MGTREKVVIRLIVRAMRNPTNPTAVRDVEAFACSYGVVPSTPTETACAILEAMAQN